MKQITPNKFFKTLNSLIKKDDTGYSIKPLLEKLNLTLDQVNEWAKQDIDWENTLGVFRTKCCAKATIDGLERRLIASEAFKCMYEYDPEIRARYTPEEYERTVIEMEMEQAAQSA